MRPDAAPPLPLLRERQLRPGQRWIFSAGFNVGPRLADTTRVDSELPDLARLAEAGARVAVLSHQGSHRDGTARELDYLARYLGRALGRPVGYHPGNDSPGALDRARSLQDGEIVLFGNTRAHPGEETDDPGLARRFALLGDAVAVGGFSKAHRAHASNVGILRHLPGYAADSLIRETRALDPWAGHGPDRYSVAVLGGVKPEKTLTGLSGLTPVYHLVIPGGVVLNTLLRVRGHDIGDSALGMRPDSCAEAAAQVLGRPGAELHLPDEVVVADRGGRSSVVRVADGVPPGHAIVDFHLTERTLKRLEELRVRGGRALMAGTPSRYTEGFGAAVGPLLDAFAAPGVDALLLGGDTVAELPWQGPVSGGGGSALQYLADGTCAVFDALRSDQNTGRTATR